jgi:uncharacterized membrane protein
MHVSLLDLQGMLDGRMFALGYLGWFVSPWVLFATTALVVIVTWRRQFATNAWRAMAS